MKTTSLCLFFDESGKQKDDKPKLMEGQSLYCGERFNISDSCLISSF